MTIINTEYDIEKAFRSVEDELIASMIRNLDHHRAEEEKEGLKWSQWQVEQLAALDEYKKKNLKKYKGVFGKINASIEDIILMQRAAGNAQQEISILKAIKEGAKLRKAKKSISASGSFFKINDKKINALVNATVNDFEKGELSILRRANDQYRKIIFNAQMYAATGATYEKAVDMATKNFLSAGINCIEYKNGARHTMSEYADMALRTAQKRAYLTGEGEKRKEWGISLVIVNKRGNPCPKCLPFVGKVMIDDVWSGGVPDGEHMLMSNAITGGLYHPRCNDSHTTYFEGISEAGESYTKEELKKIADDYNLEQKQQYAKREAERMGRLAKNSLDPLNKQKYEARAKEWKKTFFDIDISGLKKIIPDIKFSTRMGSSITAKQKFEDTMTVSKAYTELPIKVKKTLNDTVFEFGYDGSACDIRNKTIRVGIGASKDEMFHEYGHLIENYMMNSTDVKKYKEYLVDGLSYSDIMVETYYDSVGNEVDIFLLKGNRFESEYQSRLYVLDVDEALNFDGTINTDMLGEIISEPFRKYMICERVSDEAKLLIERAVL